MAADPARLKYLAERGHFGHAALLDPEAFVQSAQPAIAAPLVAQNSVNELGIPDKMTLGTVREAAPKASTVGTINTDVAEERMRAFWAKREAELLQQEAQKSMENP